MSKTITANIPARKGTWAGKPHVYAAHTNVFLQDDTGHWTTDGMSVLESEVIDCCKQASNWREIMVNHFPMIFAAAQSGE